MYYETSVAFRHGFGRRRIPHYDEILQHFQEFHDKLPLPGSPFLRSDERRRD